MRRNSLIFAYGMLLPVLLVMALLVFYPVVLTFVDSLQNIDLMLPGPTTFVGFTNYVSQLGDPTVQQTIGNTAFYLVVASIIELSVGLAFALSLRGSFRGRGILLAIAILPWALPPVVNGVIWGWILNPSFGVLNGILHTLHIIGTYQIWLANAGPARLFVTVVHVWRMLPLDTVIILAVLQSIPAPLYEAARIDGAGDLQLFRHITLPLLKPAIAIALSQGTIAAINIFDEPYVLTGMSLDTRPILVQTYLVTFRDLQLSSGMALSFLTTLATVVISVVFILWMYRGAHER
jgi:multiple sugar transport system permease protein